MDHFFRGKGSEIISLIDVALFVGRGIDPRSPIDYNYMRKGDVIAEFDVLWDYNMRLNYVL